MTDAREARGLVLARDNRNRIKVKRGMYIVPSASHAGSYVVDPKEKSCTCPDHLTTARVCKHMHAVLFVRRRVVLTDGQSMEEPKKPTYQQNSWSAYNEAQTKERHHFEILLRDLVSGIPTPPQRTGRPRLPWSDLIYSMVTKVYSTMSTRRAMTDIHECEEKGFIDATPHFNSVIRAMNTPEMIPILRDLIAQSSVPLRAIETDFAVDATGFTTDQYHKWFDEKYGRVKSMQRWVKGHAFVGVKTHIVVAADVTEFDVHDAAMFKSLLDRAAEHHTIREVSADKGYVGYEHFKAVEKLGAVPYIAFKKNTVANERSAGPAIWKKMFHMYSLNREAWLDRYHLRSNSETVFSGIKRTLGSHLRSRKPTSQYVEVLAKILAWNLRMTVHSIYELGIEPVFWPDAAKPGNEPPPAAPI